MSHYHLRVHHPKLGWCMWGVRAPIRKVNGVRLARAMGHLKCPQLCKFLECKNRHPQSVYRSRSADSLYATCSTRSIKFYYIIYNLVYLPRENLQNLNKLHLINYILKKSLIQNINK